MLYIDVAAGGSYYISTMEQTVRKYAGRQENRENEREAGAFLELFIIVMVLSTLAVIAFPNMGRLFN